MSNRLVMMTTAAMLVVGSAAMIEPAQAGFAGSGTAMQSVSQSLDLTQKARRICRQVRRCNGPFWTCRWERQCYITADYPPEHGRR